MSLKELIERRDLEVEVKKEATDALIKNIRNLMAETRDWHVRYIEWEPTGTLSNIPFTWLGMKMWPKKLEEHHLNYISGKHILYMYTLSHEQSEAMRLSVFGGITSGAIKSNWLYEWRFDYRQDGWVELLVGM